MWLTIDGRDVEARPGATLAEICACLSIDVASMWTGRERASPAAVAGLHPLTPGAAVTRERAEPSSTPPTAHLEVVSGPSRGLLRELRDGLTIGRGAECEAVLDDPAVSSLHAVITGPPWRLRDAGSRNGIGGLGRSRRLGDCDHVTLGDTVLAVRLDHAIRRPLVDSFLPDADSRPPGPASIDGATGPCEEAAARRSLGARAAPASRLPRWADLAGAGREWVVGLSGDAVMALDPERRGRVLVVGSDQDRVDAAVALLRLSRAAIGVAASGAPSADHRLWSQDSVTGSTSPASIPPSEVAGCLAMVCLADADQAAAQRLLGLRSLPAMAPGEALIRQGGRIALVTLALAIAERTPPAWPWGDEPPEGIALAQSVEGSTLAASAAA